MYTFALHSLEMHVQLLVVAFGEGENLERSFRSHGSVKTCAMTNLNPIHSASFPPSPLPLLS